MPMNDTMNQKEKLMAFAYVFLLFISITTICCLLIFYYNSDFQVFSQKDFAITKMERIKEYQDVQGRMYPIVDSLYSKINKYNPAVNAMYEENEIKLMINELNNVHNKYSWDTRYKVFLHMSEFYNMWFIDKKNLWSKKENSTKFKKDMEECQMKSPDRR